MDFKISIISQTEVDANKWNACVERNDNGLIYSQYEYLNTMTDNWLAVIVNDYEAVMAIPFRIKYGIKYVYTPHFMQQFGMIGNAGEIKLINVLQDLFKYGTYTFNFSNGENVEKIKVTKRSNYIINLNTSYESICSKYSTSMQRNIDKAKKLNLMVEDADIDTCITWYKKRKTFAEEGITEKELGNLKTICEHYQQQGKIICKKVINPQTQKITSTLLCLKDSKRIYHLLPTTSSEGKMLSSMHYLVDLLLKEYSNTKLLYDFEGSDIPGVQQFYFQFGSVLQAYYQIHYNKIPFLKWIKF